MIVTPAISAFGVEIRVAARFASTLTTLWNVLCQRQCKEPDSGIQIQSRAPRALAVTVFSKSSNQETVYLKKRKMADPVLVSPGLRASNSPAPVNSNRFFFWSSSSKLQSRAKLPESARQPCAGFGNFSNATFSAILSSADSAKRFDFLDALWQPSRAGHLLKLREGVRENAARVTGHSIYRHDYRTLWQEESLPAPGHSAAHRPLRRGSGSRRLAECSTIRAIPGDSAEPRKRFAQNIFLSLNCSVAGMCWYDRPPPRFLKVSALCFSTFFPPVQSPPAVRPD